MTLKARRATLSATLLAAGLSLSGAVNAAFISGVWQGDANFDSQGRFSDCAMTAQASSGLLIGFIISKRYEWGLVVADERQRFALGSTEIVALHIDKRDPIEAIAKVVDIHGIVIPLENSASVLEGFREGKALTVIGEKLKISIKLTGTRAAIAALAACVTENLASEKVDAGPRWRSRHALRTLFNQSDGTTLPTPQPGPLPRPSPLQGEGEKTPLQFSPP